MSDEFDPTDIRSQERAKQDKELRAKLAKDNEEADFKWLMSSKRGRRIVWRLLERAKVFHPSWNTNSMTMAFLEGNKNEGYRTLSLIHTLCPEIYPVMVRENTSDNRNDADGNGRNDH